MGQQTAGASTGLAGVLEKVPIAGFNSLPHVVQVCTVQRVCVGLLSCVGMGERRDKSDSVALVVVPVASQHGARPRWAPALCLRIDRSIEIEKEEARAPVHACKNSWPPHTHCRTPFDPLTPPHPHTKHIHTRPQVFVLVAIVLHAAAFLAWGLLFIREQKGPKEKPKAH